MKMNHINNIRHAWSHRHDPECARLLAYILWRLILGTLLLSLVSFVLFNIWALLAENDTEVLTVAGRVETIRREALSDVLDQFEQRAQQYGHLKQNLPSVVDPS